MPKFGEVLNGKVIKIFKKGALVKLSSNDVAYLPIREIASEYVKDINDYLKVDQKIDVRIIGRSKKDNKFTLSLKRASENVNKELQFQKKLDRFMKDSKEKMFQLQKNKERKHGIKRKKNDNNK